MRKTPAKKLTAHQIRAVAVQAQADPRTVQRVLAGKPVRVMVGERIAAALKAAGLLALLLSLFPSCDSGEEQMALDKVTTSWPLAGGLDTKRSPIALSPGSNLLVQDVREERLGEWRRRDGFGQSANDVITPGTFGAPLVVGVTGNGVPFVRTDGDVAEAGIYDASANGLRWGAPTAPAGRAADHFTRPLLYSARPLFEIPQGSGIVSNLRLYASCYGAKSILTAASYSFSIVGVAFATFSRNSGAVLAGDASALVPGNQVACVAAGAYLLAFYTVPSSRTLVVRRYLDATGAFVDQTVLSTESVAVNKVDAIYYGGATVTVVWSKSTTKTGFMEYDFANNVATTNVEIVQDSSGALSLFEDPDNSGNRFVAVSSSVPDVRVLTMTSAGAVLSNVQADTIAATSIAGVAFESGAGWMLLAESSGTLRLSKRRGGSITAGIAIAGDSTANFYGLDSNMWREPGQNRVGVVIGVHSGSVADPQDSYFEATIDETNSKLLWQVPVNQLDGYTRISLLSNLSRWTRTAANERRAILPRIYRIDRSGSALSRQLVFDDVRLFAPSVGSIENVGAPAAFGDSAYVPGGALAVVNPSAPTVQLPLGMAVLPFAPTLTPSVAGGALTLLKTYGYQLVIKVTDGTGREWRSPPSELTQVTLAGAQNTILVESPVSNLDDDKQRTVEIYRTAGNTSDFRRVYDATYPPGTAITSGGLSKVSFTDTLADTAQAQGEFIYTTGELPTAPTPPAKHVAVALGRMFLARADRRTVRYSKTLRANRLPEFPDEMELDVDDEFGDVTGMIGLDDKVVVYKAGAVYVISGQGLDDAGGGSDFNVVRVASDKGAIVGSPMVGVGSDAWFVSDRGICTINAANQTDFVGGAVDLFLHQSQLQAQETIRAAVYSSTKDEVRFVTNSSVLVLNRMFGIWSRWVGGLVTGSPLARSIMVGGRQWIIREDGAVFIEGDSSQLTDGATDFQGFLRSQWVIPAGPEGRMRLYRARVLATRAPGGMPILPQLSVFFDYDDTTRVDFDPPAPLDPKDLTVRLEGAPLVQRQTCNAFSEMMTFPASDTTWRVERWGAVVGVAPGYQRLTSSEQWK